MAKRSPEFKLKVTLKAVQVRVGIRALAHLYGIDLSTIQYWIQRYQHHGNKAFAKKYSDYSAKFKLAALEPQPKRRPPIMKISILKHPKIRLPTNEDGLAQL